MFTFVFDDVPKEVKATQTFKFLFIYLFLVKIIPLLNKIVRK